MRSYNWKSLIKHHKFVSVLIFGINVTVQAGHSQLVFILVKKTLILLFGAYFVLLDLI